MSERAYTLADITVIVVTYNSAHCIADLAHPLASGVKVIFVDNASQDDSLLQIRQWIPHARIIACDRNLGFGVANNRALAQCDTPFALLLNPDCLAQASQFEALMTVAHRYPQTAVVAPQLTDPSGRVELNYRFPSVDWKPQGPAAEGECSVGFVCGAVMLLRRERFIDLGYFDEDFFLYYEDDDLCLRVHRAKLGIVLAPQVRIIHASRGSVRGNAPWRAEYWRGYHHAQSKIRFTQKHRGLKQAKLLRGKVLALSLLGLPLRLLLPVPKLVARYCGRIMGLSRFTL